MEIFEKILKNQLTEAGMLQNSLPDLQKIVAKRFMLNFNDSLDIANALVNIHRISKQKSLKIAAIPNWISKQKMDTSSSPQLKGAPANMQVYDTKNGKRR